MSEHPRYRVHPVVTPLPSRASIGDADPEPTTTPLKNDPFIRPEAEDDDGYDPFSDRPPTPEPTFQEDPWK